MTDFTEYAINGRVLFWYLVGKNARHNQEIVDLAHSTDLWFHVSVLPSEHVIVRPAGTGTKNSNAKKNRNAVVKHGALLCKAKSRYRSTIDLPIVYTEVRNVAHVVGAPGRVTVTDEKIIRV